jgi:hypothetical protein
VKRVDVDTIVDELVTGLEVKDKWVSRLRNAVASGMCS